MCLGQAEIEESKEQEDVHQCAMLFISAMTSDRDREILIYLSNYQSHPRLTSRHRPLCKILALGIEFVQAGPVIIPRAYVPRMLCNIEVVSPVAIAQHFEVVPYASQGAEWRHRIVLECVAMSCLALMRAG